MCKFAFKFLYRKNSKGMFLGGGWHSESLHFLSLLFCFFQIFYNKNILVFFVLFFKEHIFFNKKKNTAHHQEAQL